MVNRNVVVSTYRDTDKLRPMTLGQRIAARAREKKFSQAKLARDAKVPQSTMNTLINSDARWSPHLTRIARALETTVDYLVGDTDDPAEGAPPPPPAPTVQHIMMPVALPSENALSDMFEGMLLAIETRDRPEAEVARELAQLLPTALSQLRGRLFELPIPPASEATPEVPAIEAAGPPR